MILELQIHLKDSSKFNSKTGKIKQRNKSDGCNKSSSDKEEASLGRSTKYIEDEAKTVEMTDTKSLLMLYAISRIHLKTSFLEQDEQLEFPAVIKMAEWSSNLYLLMELLMRVQRQKNFF